jgi:hypothetical protein
VDRQPLPIYQMAKFLLVENYLDGVFAIGLFSQNCGLPAAKNRDGVKDAPMTGYPATFGNSRWVTQQMHQNRAGEQNIATLRL